MKKFSLFQFLLTVSCCLCFSQNYNFSFEKVSNVQRLPDGWYELFTGPYNTSIDSINTYSGKYSLLIESMDENSTYVLMYDIPAKYRGKRITLKAYVKTSNNNQTFVMRLVEFSNNLQRQNILPLIHETTTNWKQYQTTISMSRRVEKFCIRFDFYGRGKFWIDDIEIQIDGKDISKAKKRILRTFPAERDREFDNDSNIEFEELNEKVINDLELLGKLWGFLKYHHPQIGTGKYNWDYELFRILPAYLQTKNIEQRDNILLEWIDKYGKIRKCRKCVETSEDAYLKPDLLWVENSNMSNELKNVIRNIYSNRHQGKHYYISLSYRHSIFGNPIFLNENSYTNMAYYPDAGFRLLALFRYWNMIQYFFPYKYITDKNWDDVLKKYIHIFISAKNDFEYELAALKIVGDINDSHANLFNKIFWSRGNYRPPFRIQFIERKWIVTDYYNAELQEESGLEIGDIITHINNKTVENIVDSVRKYYPASNEAAKMRDISYNLLRNNRNSINIQYISSGQSKQKELTLYPRDSLNIINRNEQSYKLLYGNIGYITLATIKYEDIPAIKEVFKNTKGMIIDIRNYPSVDTRYELGSYFVSKYTPFAKHTIGNVKNPGEFNFSPRLSGIPKADNDETYQGKLVVIVNELTQSFAEHTAMAFRAGDNTTIIGSTTAGADGNVSLIFLPGGLQTLISGIGVYYPDGTQTQRIGIVPDVWIEPTINGIIEGKDELLERAIQIINEYDKQ